MEEPVHMVGIQAQAPPQQEGIVVAVVSPGEDHVELSRNHLAGYSDLLHPSADVQPECVAKRVVTGRHDHELERRHLLAVRHDQALAALQDFILLHVYLRLNLP